MILMGWLCRKTQIFTCCDNFRAVYMCYNWWTPMSLVGQCLSWQQQSLSSLDGYMVRHIVVLTLSPLFLKWTLQTLNSDTSIVANEGFSQKISSRSALFAKVSVLIYRDKRFKRQTSKTGMLYPYILTRSFLIALLIVDSAGIVEANMVNSNFCYILCVRSVTWKLLEMFHETLHKYIAPWDNLQTTRTITLVYLLLDLQPFKHRY